MPFRIRPHRRFPLQWPVTYCASPFEDQGTAWNLSCIGLQLSGDLPMRSEEPLSLTVTLPNEHRIWLRHYVKRLVQKPTEHVLA